MEYIYNDTFRLSFVERFVLFWSFHHQRFHCIHTLIANIIEIMSVGKKMTAISAMLFSIKTSCDFLTG